MFHPQFKKMSNDNENSKCLTEDIDKESEIEYEDEKK